MEVWEEKEIRVTLGFLAWKTGWVMEHLDGKSQDAPVFGAPKKLWSIRKEMSSREMVCGSEAKLGGQWIIGSHH